MRPSQLLGPELQNFLAQSPDEMRTTLEDVHPEDLAAVLGELPDADAAAVMRALPDALGAEVMERLPIEKQVQIIETLGSRDSVGIVSEMSPDDRVDLVQEIPDAMATELLSEIAEAEPEIAEELRELAAHAEDTAGGLMTTEYVGLSPETKVWEAIDAIRLLSRNNGVETIYSIYVLAYGEKLVGVVSLRDLILADPANTLADIMTESVVRMAPTDDQEHVAATMAKYDLTALPVVNERGLMLGVVTVDDVVDVVIEEATEDAHKQGGLMPLEDSYFQTGFSTFLTKRASWLCVLFVGSTITTNVLEAHASVMSALLQLVVFIPVIIASGGNAGSQSSTLIIRGLAVGEIVPRDWLRVAARELGIGIALGCLLAVFGFARAYFMGDEMALDIALTVASSIVAVVTIGCLAGSLLPLLIKRAGLDPAVSSAPFIASVVDVVGLMVYFAMAKALLGL